MRMRRCSAQLLFSPPTPPELNMRDLGRTTLGIFSLSPPQVWGCGGRGEVLPSRSFFLFIPLPLREGSYKSSQRLFFV